MYNCECGADLIQEDCETIIGVCQESPVVKDYNALVNKPQINGVTLQGNKTSEDLGIAQEIADAVSAEATLRENADTALGGRIDDEITAREGADTALGGRIDNANTRIDNEILARQGADNNLQTQIDAITSKSDVVDVVANYQALLAYDTSELNDNDVIKVLDDETHEDALTYYRWSTTTQTWTYIGQEAPYYSKGQMDVKLAEKQDKLIAGANIQIAQDGKTISATDTTYTAGNGLNLNGTEFSADTTVLATKSDLDSYYTKTETDTKLAPKLETEVVSTLPATGTEGKLYLTPKTYTTGSASGNPITIALGEDEGAIDSFKLDGNTEQQTYTGKNKLHYPYTGGTVGTGLTWTVADDGTIHVTGTIGTVNKSYYLYQRSQDTFDMPELGAGTYKVFWDITGTGTQPRVTIQDANGYHNSSSGEVTIGTAAKPTNIYIQFTSTMSGDVDLYIKPMLELTSEADTYEPYVGGTPSPNPTFPQQIQTVTGTQTVEIIGKNLFNKDGLALVGKYLDSSGNEVANPNWGYTGFIPVIAGEKYTISGYLITANAPKNCYYDSNKSFVSSVGHNSGTETLTIPSGVSYIRIGVYNYVSGGGAQVQESPVVMFEESDTATAYTPYNKQTMPLDLGTIELCKLGTYQDYIWKDGDDWKFHKATKKTTLTGTEQWSSGGAGNHCCYTTAITDYATSNNVPLSPYFGGVSNVNGAGTMGGKPDNSIAFIDQSATVRFYIRTTKFETDAATLKTWLSTHNTDVYYALATATDTTITDQTLIAQLEAVRTASLENGTNTITNSTPEPNLAGDMELNYHEYDPHSRYNKWLWLDINENYEQIGS